MTQPDPASPPPPAAPASNVPVQVPAEFRALLAQSVRGARGELDGIHVDEDRVIERLWGSVREALERAGVGTVREADVADALAALVIPDLCLATAMACGEPYSWQVFQKRYGDYARRLCAHYVAAPAAAEELADTITADLFLPRRDGEPPRIAQYRGFGTLKGWLKVILRNLAMDRHRAEKRTVSLDEDSSSSRGEEGTGRLERLAAPSPGPDTELIRSRCEEVMQEALPKAVSGLDDKERTLLHLYFIRGLQGNELAPMYRVHESTVSRWLDKLRAHLRATVEQVARVRCGMSKADVRECYDLIGKGCRAPIDTSLPETRKKGGGRAS